MVESTDEMALVVDYPQSQKQKPSNIFSDPKFWPNVKPFIEGGLAGAMSTIPIPMGAISLKFLSKKHKSLLHLDYQNLKPEEKELFAKVCKFFYPNIGIDDGEKEWLAKLEKIQSQKLKVLNNFVKRTPSLLVVSTIKNAMLFGPFGFLTRNVELVNKGIPLSIDQEAGCAMISGAVGACVTTPLYMSYYRTFGMANATQTSMMQEIYCKSQKEGILSLWKGGRCIGNGLFAMNMGMLASYNRSYEYLRESVGLTADNCVLGAGLASGFAAATFFYPYIFVHRTMISMKPDMNGKYPFTGYLDCAGKILKFYGPLAFFRGSTPHFLNHSIHVMVLWYCLDKVKKIDESYGW